MTTLMEVLVLIAAMFIGYRLAELGIIIFEYFRKE